MLIPSNLGQLINSFNAAAWIFYGLCFASLLIMRITHRRDIRPYKVCSWLYNIVYMCKKTKVIKIGVALTCQSSINEIILQL